MRTTKPGITLVSAAATFACGVALSQESRPPQISLSAEQYQAVVCLLPGRMRRLGGRLTYVERRRPIETTAADCEIRGGEYTVYDRANYETALRIWMEAADGESDPAARSRAQTYVGEIYEKRLGEPDYEQAARWYRRAAESGNTRAMLHLAYLYENGLGVEQDVTRALALWREGMGIGEDLVLASELEAVRSEAERRIDALTAELDRQNRSTQQLQEQLANNLQLLNRQRAAVEAAQREMAALNLQLEEERARPVGSGPELAALQQELEERVNVMDDQQARIALLETEIVAQRAQLSASTSAAEIHEQRLRQALDSLARQELESAELAESLARRDAQIALLEREITAANTALETQRRQQSTIQAEMARLTREAPADSAERAEMLARMGALQEQLTDAERRIADRESRIARMQQSLVAERAVFERTLGSAAAARSELEAELAQVRAEREELQVRLEHRDGEAAALRARLSETGGDLAAQELELERLRDQLADAQRSAASAVDRSEIEQLQSQLQMKEAEVERGNSMLADMRNQWLTARTEAQSLRQELSERSTDTVTVEAKLRAELSMREQEIVRATMERNQMAAALEQQRLEKDLLREEKLSAERRLTELQAGMERDREGMGARYRQLLEELSAKDQAIAAKEQAIMSLQARLREQSLEAEGLLVDRNMVAANLTRTFAPGLTNLPIPEGIDIASYRYRALVIGNWDYTYIPDLRTVEQDVRTVKTLLEQRYGFEVDLRTNLTLSQMYSALNDLRSYGEDDFVLIYFAGHGMIDEFENGYWQPVDYQPRQDPSATAVSVAQITQHLNMMGAKHVLVVADSCYSGALLRENSVEIRNVQQRLRHWLNNDSRTVLTSGGVAPVLDEGGGGHSVFANAFINVLANNTDVLSGEALHARLRDTIRYDSSQLNLEQTPLFAGLADAGHANGQFVFLPR